MLFTGFEPMTLALSEPRATNCAKRAWYYSENHHYNTLYNMYYSLYNIIMCFSIFSYKYFLMVQINFYLNNHIYL